MIFPAASLRSWRDFTSACFVSASDANGEASRKLYCEQSRARNPTSYAFYPTENLFNHQIHLIEEEKTKTFAFAFLMLSLFLCLLTLCSAQSWSFQKLIFGNKSEHLSATNERCVKSDLA